MQETITHDCIIVGGGWAGLSCAVNLVKQGVKPLLLEAASQLGGRARSVNFAGQLVDNGQHVMLSAYKEVQDLLAYLHVPENFISKQRFYLHILNNLNINLPNLPIPVNLLWGLLCSTGISCREKYFLVKFARHVHVTKYTNIPDCSTEEYFRKLKTPTNLIEKIFKPLVVSSLSTPFNLASTQTFLRVLRASFTRSHQDCNWLFINAHLSDLLPIPAEKYLLKNTSIIKTNFRVASISKENNIFKVATIKNSFLAKQVVLAVHPKAVLKIDLSDFPELSLLRNNMQQLKFQPIITIYYKFADEIKLPHRMNGLLNSLGDFMFSVYKYSNLLSVVVSSTEKSMIDNSGLAKNIFTELQQQFTLPEYIDYKIIHEKFAAFSCVANVDAIRPSNITAVENLFLAGDYTNTGLPATLEGAVQSGRVCAQLVLAKGRWNCSLNS
jgi:squalene-associated FAD-dependent desaturase